MSPMRPPLMAQPGYHVITSTSLHVECMCARGRAREPTSVALVAMATFQQSNRLQIASCISFPSPCPHPLPFHSLFASLSPSLCPICFFGVFFRRRRVEVVLEAACSTLTGHLATLLLHFHSIMKPHLFIYSFCISQVGPRQTQIKRLAGCFSFLRVIV